VTLRRIRLVPANHTNDNEPPAAPSGEIADVLRDLLPQLLQEPAIQEAVANACTRGHLWEAKKHHPSARGPYRG